MFQFFRRTIDRDQRGFTLIELLIVVAIIAILAAILIPNFLRARVQSQIAATKGNLKNMATALESYFVDNGIYPAAMTSLTSPVQYLRAIGADPCTKGSYTGYYTSLGTPSGTDYKLSVPYTGTACVQVIPGVSYTPGGGLQETP